MTAEYSIDTFRQAFSDFSGDTVSVYVPRPAIEVGGEKWRILRKNVIDSVRDTAPKATSILKRLESFELQDFKGNGIALFDDGKSYRMAHLNARPVGSVMSGQPPFILPLLADYQAREAHWVLHATKARPKLYLYSGGHLADMTDRLDAPAYRSVEARRDVQDDVFFHSSSRGSARNSDSRSTFHSLGTDVSEEREKTDEAFFNDLANAVEEALPYQTETLHVIGDAGTVGRFAQTAHTGSLEIVQHHANVSEADIANRVEEALAEARAETETGLPEGKSLPDMVEAARNGRVETLYLPVEIAHLEDMSGKADEHVAMRAWEAGSDEVEQNRTAYIAMENGAGISWYEANAHDAVAEMRADLRW